MKLERIPCEVARMKDEDNLQWLRLTMNDEGAFVWYRPTDFGFVILTDKEADELELAYRRTLS